MRENRLFNMEEFIRERKSVSLDELCKKFKVSKNTVRRDISEIIERSDIRKTYGGVTAPYNRIPPSFAERSSINVQKKQLIGKYAAEFVNDGDIIYIDSGTTTCQMIDYLRNKKDITVITNSLDVLNKVSYFPSIQLVSLSGIFNRKTNSFIGQSTIDVLEVFNISKAFMAANGITIQNGAMQSTSIEFAIKKMVVSRSDSVYLMIENHKLGEVSLLSYCRPEEISAIITDHKPNEEFCDQFAAVGGQIVVAKE